ncbi:MAG TPA: long-chain-fatty-acid--CoA ligase [Bryobacteraceae bacterium]|nr:long-chain-fatty-acid--CoA ligase [Bryobacteraceae bacterium]
MFVPLTPIRFLYRAVDIFGKHIGIVSGEHQFTYAEFGRRCEQLAKALLRAGVQPGDRVAFLSFNNHQLLEGYYGVPMAGAVVMPLNVRLTVSELSVIIRHAGARILFYEPDFEGIATELPVERKVRIGAEYESLLAAEEPERVDFMGIDENSIAELFYTSGSTGTPKGVMLSHRTLYLHAFSVATCYVEPVSMVDLHTIPLFHANGWGHAHASTMMGVKHVMVRRFDPVGVYELIHKHRATEMSLVPTMANALLAVPDTDAYDLSSLRQIQIGGAAASPELIERMENRFRCRVFAGYGLTETAPVLTFARPKRELTIASERERFERQAMTGWPVPGVEVRVVDNDGQDVPRDRSTMGEVITRSDHVMTGYYAEPEATNDVMAGGWFHTGDMAVWDDDGYIHIVDRKKEIIVSGGENISSIEVEKAIAAHPEVFECAVVAAPDDKWGEIPAAIVVRKPGSSLDAKSLCAFLDNRLAKFKIPRKIDFSEEPLPKTGTGKIRKLVLKEQYWIGKAKRVQG